MLDVRAQSMKGLFITFEGNEGSGKSTQVPLLVERLRQWGQTVRIFREPGGTPIGEEIRHTLKHSAANAAMTREAELLLMNASRAQLVREVIRPALDRGEIIVSDRFYDSTTAYQGYGRQLDLQTVRHVIDLAVGDTRPDVTLFLRVPQEVSEERQRSRQSTMPFIRDRMEEADRCRRFGRRSPSLHLAGDRTAGRHARDVTVQVRRSTCRCNPGESHRFRHLIPDLSARLRAAHSTHGAS
jgi:dTMP kinase